MTSSQVESMAAMKTPFANDANQRDTIRDDSSETAPSFADGWPEAFQKDIVNDGGKYVERKQMNALGYYATQPMYCLMTGRPILYDSNFATKIGGYPKGAVLWYVDGTLTGNPMITLICSNQDNNTTQPSASTIDPSSGTVWWTRVRLTIAGTESDAANIETMALCLNSLPNVGSTALRTVSTKGGLRVWIGTLDQYSALTTKQSDVFYFATES